MNRNLVLIYNNLKRRRSQAIISIMIVAITIFIFTLLLATIQVMKEGLNTSKEKLGADLVLIPRHASVENRELLFTASPENIYMPNSVLEKLDSFEGIKSFTPQFFAQTLALSCCSPGEEVRIIGFDPKTDFVLKPHLKLGEFSLDENDIVLGSNFDENLIGRPYLILGNSFVPKSKLEATGTGMDNTIFINIDKLRDVSKNSVFANTLWKEKDPFDSISVVLVKLEEGSDPQDFKERIEKEKIEAKVVFTGETISNLQNQIKIMISILIAFWLGSLVITFLSLFGRFNALANSRKKEIGLMRALGVKKSSIFIQVIGECSFMALVGGLVGSIVASLCMRTVISFIKNAFTISPSVWNYKVALVSIVISCLISFIIGCMAALYPASKSASLDPQNAITRGEL